MSEQKNSIFAEISNQYSHLTASEKKIADYVLSHKSAVQYMSISELAYECGVGDATVSRFCRQLNLNGYNSFKLSLAKSAASDDPLLTTNGLSQGSEYVTDNNEILSLGRNLCTSYMEVLTQTISYLRPTEIRRAVTYMADADRIYCMGQGASMILAQEAAHLMSTISSNYFAIAGSHVQTSCAALMTERDVVLFFSYSGSTKEIVDLIKLAKDHGAHVILITRFLRSPGASISDVVLQCGSNEQPFQLGTINAKIAQLFIVDILYQELCRRDPEMTRQNREKIAEALADKHL